MIGNRINYGMSGFRGQSYHLLNTEEQIDDYLLDIKANLLSKEEIINYLREELKEVKDEAYASAEMQEMKTKLDEARNDLNRGFGISEVQSEQIREWQNKHDAEEHGNINGYHGAIGGGFSYKFYPTSIGTIGECICSTCSNLAHIEAATIATTVQKKKGYDNDTYVSYMKKHNGMFTFEDL